MLDWGLEDGTSRLGMGLHWHTKTCWVRCAFAAGCHDLWVTMIGSDSQNQPQRWKIVDSFGGRREREDRGGGI
jgi:hypothetical protein